MRWLDLIERRFHWLTIPQFPLFIATANGLIYLMAQFQPIFVNRLTLNPVALLAGEWWRAVTFLFVPPLSMNPIFLVFWLLFLYQMAQALERAWGEFRFFIFYLGGAAVTVITALLLLHGPVGNSFLNATLFLAFATLFPDFELFVFPLPFGIKIKILAWIIWVWLASVFLVGTFATRIAIVAALLNYILFFGMDIWSGIQRRWQVYRNRRRFRP